MEKNKRRYQKPTIKFRQELFWDVDPKKIDPKKHAQYIIERILDFGNDKEARWIFQNYSKKTLQKVVKNSRVLHNQTRVLWNEIVKN